MRLGPHKLDFVHQTHSDFFGGRPSGHLDLAQCYPEPLMKLFVIQFVTSFLVKSWGGDERGNASGHLQSVIAQEGGVVDSSSVMLFLFFSKVQFLPIEKYCFGKVRPMKLRSCGSNYVIQIGYIYYLDKYNHSLEKALTV